MTNPEDLKSAYNAGHDAVKRVPRWLIPALCVAAIVVVKLMTWLTR